MSQLRWNVVANYVGQGWRALMGLAFIPLYIDFLGMESYGLIGVFGVMQAWLSLLSMGLSPTLNREMARYKAGTHSAQSIHDLLRSFEIICIGISLFVVSLIGLSANVLASKWFIVENLPTSTVASALFCMSFVMAFRFLEGLYQGALFGLQRQVWFNGVSIVLATLRGIGAIGVLLWVSTTIQAFFLWQAFVSLLSVLVFFWGVRRTLEKPPAPPSFSRKALAEVWAFASGMIGITLLSLLLTQLDKVILSRVLPLKVFGYYTLAATVTGVLYMAITPLYSAVYPKMVEMVAAEKIDELTAIYHKSAQLGTIVIAPAMLLLVFFSGGILYMWSGKMELVTYAAPIISVLAVGIFLNGIMNAPYYLQLAYGWTSLSIKINIVAVLFLGSLMLYVAPRFGPIGAAWVWVLLNSCYVTIGIYLMHRRLLPEEKWNWYGFDVIFPILGASSVTFLAWLLRPSGYQSRMLWFFFLLVTGLLATVGAILCARDVRPRMFALVKRVLQN